ncbi:MAG TPA: hypothetical protein VFF37_07125 [Streptomyces sp.]|nr:hypothetical protein [Streptomyces sp.]
MTGDELQRLRAEASRDDYVSMARLARALYEQGANSREVVLQCYGVGFPEEFFVITEAGTEALDLMVDYPNQPWQTAIALDRGGPAPTPHSLAGMEQRVFARDQDLMPLVWCVKTGVMHGNSLLCYRLSELRMRRSTVYRVALPVEAHHGIVHCGDSLLTALHEHHASYVGWLEKELGDPANARRGGPAKEEVTEMQELVTLIEELQRLVTSRQGA